MYTQTDTQPSTLSGADLAPAVQSVTALVRADEDTFREATDGLDFKHTHDLHWMRRGEQLMTRDRDHRRTVEELLNPNRGTVSAGRDTRVIDVVVLGTDEDGNLTDAVALTGEDRAPWRVVVGGKRSMECSYTKESALLLWLDATTNGGRPSGAAGYAARVLRLDGFED